MWNIPSEIRLSKLPQNTEKVETLEKLVHIHFFLGGCDWYAIEYHPEDEAFFGFVILNGDKEMGEFGYFSFAELKELKVNGFLEVDCERAKYWKPQKIRDIKGLEFLIRRWK